MGAEKREPMVDSILPLLEARRAYEFSQSGHTRGKISYASGTEPEPSKGNSHDDADNYLGACSSPVRDQWRFGKDTTDRDGHEKNHLPIRKRPSAVHNGDVTMKTKYEARLPVRLGPE
jgi:hypothetical protein